MISDRVHALLCRLGPMSSAEVAHVCPATKRRAQFTLRNLRLRGLVRREGELWHGVDLSKYERRAA